MKKLKAIKNHNQILIIIIGLFTTTNLFSQNADFKLLYNCNAGKLPMWDKTMKGVSWSVYPAMPLTVGGIWLDGYLRKDNERMRNGYKSAITLCLANGLSYGLKYSIKRDRPFVTYPDKIEQRTHVGPLSFPSGHTTAAFATATGLSLSTKKIGIIIPSYIYAGFVGYSRMRLGVHYPSDVFAGALIGIGSGFLVWQIDKWTRKTN
ncbi:MAG: phosphatase PAP2 family protein [Bacteroidia bacterium]